MIRFSGKGHRLKDHLYKELQLSNELKSIVIVGVFLYVLSLLYTFMIEANISNALVTDREFLPIRPE